MIPTNEFLYKVMQPELPFDLRCVQNRNVSYDPTEPENRKKKKLINNNCMRASARHHMEGAKERKDEWSTPDV